MIRPFFKRFLAAGANNAALLTPANLTTPDQLIVAHILESVAKDFHCWELEDYSPPRTVGQQVYDRDRGKKLTTFTLSRKNKSSKGLFQKTVTISFTRTENIGRDPYSSHFNKVESSSISSHINGISLTGDDTRRILRGYLDIKTGIEAAEKVAAEALARQKLNEAKWDLAEDLLGIKRDSNGRVTFLDPEKDAPELKVERPAVSAEIG